MGMREDTEPLRVAIEHAKSTGHLLFLHVMIRRRFEKCINTKAEREVLKVLLGWLKDINIT